MDRSSSRLKRLGCNRRADYSTGCEHERISERAKQRNEAKMTAEFESRCQG